MGKLYTPQTIIETLFEEGKEVTAITVQVLSTGETLVLEDVTTESLVGEDGSQGQYAMVKGTPEGHDETKGLKITPKWSDNGEIIDIYASGNVANPYIFNKEQAILTNLTE